MRRLLVLVLLVVLAGCAGGEPSPSPDEPAPETPPATTTGSATPRPRYVRPRDDGAVFTLPVGGTATLRIPRESGEPVASGTAVLLFPVVNVTDSGARDWEIRAVEPGTSMVSGTNPRFAFTVEVR